MPKAKNPSGRGLASGLNTILVTSSTWRCGSWFSKRGSSPARFVVRTPVYPTYALSNGRAVAAVALRGIGTGGPVQVKGTMTFFW